MTNLKFIKTITAGIALTMAIYPQAWAQEQLPSIDGAWLNMLMGNNPDNYSRYNNGAVIYTNDDGSYVYSSGGYFGPGGGLNYDMRYVDKDGNSKVYIFSQVTNVTINGVAYPGTSQGIRKTYDYDENGKLKAWYNYVKQGNQYVLKLIESYKYAEDGQMLVYNSQGELIGAYDNWFGKMISQNEFSNKPAEMNHLSDGKYMVKDGNNNILEEYDANGDYLKNTYNSEGSLISSNKYNKDGDIVESSVNKYDGAGNLTAAYKNGIATYKKTSYTPAEAAKAVKKGNNNKITLTFK